MPVRLEVPIEYLHERLILDAVTGELRWKATPAFGKTWNTRYAGKLAGTRLTHGYLGVSLLFASKKRVFKAHRIVFAMLNGRWPNELDHQSRVASDNKPLNLREATHAQNMQNVARRGVRSYPRGYRAQIYVNGREKHLGCFRTETEARRAYLAAKAQHHPFFTGG